MTERKDQSPTSGSQEKAGISDNSGNQNLRIPKKYKIGTYSQTEC